MQCRPHGSLRSLKTTQAPTRIYETKADYVIAGTSSTRLGKHNASEAPPKGRQWGVTGAVARPSSGDSAAAGHDLIEGRPLRPLSASRYVLHWLEPTGSDLFTRFPLHARRRCFYAQVRTTESYTPGLVVGRHQHSNAHTPGRTPRSRTPRTYGGGVTYKYNIQLLYAKMRGRGP